jgi:hypothetical protein
MSSQGRRSEGVGNVVGRSRQDERRPSGAASTAASDPGMVGVADGAGVLASGRAFVLSLPQQTTAAGTTAASVARMIQRRTMAST